MNPSTTEASKKRETENCVAKNQAANEAYVQKEYPGEKFIGSTAGLEKAHKYTKGLEIAKGVKVAESRLPVNSRQRSILRNELHQAEILTRFGNSVYLLPEIGSHKKRLLDAVVNGQLFEFRMATGNSRTLEWTFGDAKKKGDATNVFISVESDIPKKEARRRVSQVLKRHPEYTGKIVLSIPSGKTIKTGEITYNIFFWNSDALR